MADEKERMKYLIQHGDVFTTGPKASAVSIEIEAVDHDEAVRDALSVSVPKISKPISRCRSAHTSKPGEPTSTVTVLCKNYSDRKVDKRRHHMPTRSGLLTILLMVQDSL